jgi:hypothetical protein
MKRRLVLVLVAVAVGLGGSGTAQATKLAPQSPVGIAKSCGAGYRHAIIGGVHKCLRRGQFCAVRYDRQYHRYGYHCHTGRLR